MYRLCFAGSGAQQAKLWPWPSDIMAKHHRARKTFRQVRQGPYVSPDKYQGNLHGKPGLSRVC